jgi:hypothetical protein
MVAAWVMGELLAFSDVGVRIEDPDRITLMCAPGEAERVRASLAVLLEEARFACWIIAEIPGNHPHSLPDLGLCHPSEQ